MRDLRGRRITKARARRMRQIAKRFMIFGATVLVIIITLSLGSLDVKANKHQKMTEECYKDFEKIYRTDVKLYMDGMGYKNCGIMLTKTIDANNNRVYTVELHHKRFANISNDEREEIQGKLKVMAGMLDEDDILVTNILSIDS